ncbi:hypothetical protein HK100_007091 [Physocladia obscura]|uniref:Uncharacterized protein n=1 Tax=Physocladia obscura TaxID=109957 RepID=A0AAD5T5W6_9FUNG|nr:hypothetical protein HK100_007091 [Physocladia obscura]
MTTAPEFFQKPQRPQQPTNKASGVWIYVPLDQPPPPPSPPPSFPIPVLQHNSILTKPTLVGKSNSIPVITGRQLSDLERQRHLVALQKHKARAKNLETKYTHHNERMQYHAKKLGLTVEDNSLVADTIEVAEEAVETIDQEAIALQRQAEKIRRQHEQRMSQLFVDSTGFLDFGHVPIFPE